MPDNDMDNDKLRLERTGSKTDGKRFGFLKNILNSVDIMLQKANNAIHDIDESRPYDLDLGLVESEYLKMGVGDIDEFSSNHAFSLSMIYGFTRDKVAQQACYEEIRNYLWEKKMKGEIQ
jgi:hypothetical protein